MCGLVGVAGKSDPKMDKAFRILLMLDVVRGEHSTGALLVGSQGTTDIHKAVGNPFELFDSRTFDMDMNYCNNVLMGHNRYATAGAVNKVNAHPFEHEHIIGAHNGTLQTQYLLDDYRCFDVDSDNLYYHLSKNGVQETTPQLGGAYALTWWDKSNNTINFLRNKERPLFYAFTKSLKNVLWASETWMLEVAAERAGIALGKILQLPVAKHFSLEIPLCAKAQYPLLSSFVSEDVNEYVRPKPVINWNSKQTTTTTKTGGTNTSNTVVGINTKSQYLGQSTVEFKVKAPHEKSHNILMCEWTDHPEIRILFNCKKGTAEYSEYLDNPERVYEGEIKRVNRTASPVIISLKKGSVKEVYYEDSVTDVLRVNGQFVSTEEFIQRTQKGCMCCGDAPSTHEHDELVWVNDGDFVCSYCMDDERIKDHFGLSSAG